MFIDSCPSCGISRPSQTIQEENGISFAVCESCGYWHEFLKLPLVVVIGASGTGKTTICRMMGQVTQDWVCLDGDLLFSYRHGEDWDDFRRLWMELAANISQSGRPVMLFMGGMPQDFLSQDACKYFSEVRCIGIYADEDDMVKRLQARPAWRGCGNDGFISAMKPYNAAVMRLPVALNTTGKTVEQAARELVALAEQHA